MPGEVIKEGAFAGAYFRDIYSCIRKWNRKSWKEFDQLKNIDAQVIMMLVLINMVLSMKRR